MVETIQVGTIYLGKTVCIDIAKVSNDTGEVVTDVYVDLTIPEGVVFSRASMGQGTYDAQNQRWNVGTLLPLQTTNAEFCFEITDECLSSFRFDFAVNSLSSCNKDCFSLARECVVLKGQSCCEIDNCGFSKFGSESYATQCPDPLPESPQNPPENAIDDQYHIEFYENCEIWWQYGSETAEWNIVNDVVAGAGTVSVVESINSGKAIARHDNGTNIINIEETITSIDNTLGGGQKIGDYTNEQGVSFDFYETITSVSEDEKGINTYTTENGAATNFGREMASGAINITFTSSNQFTVNFPFTFSEPPIVVVNPAGPGASGQYEARIDMVTTTSFTATATFIDPGGAPANYTSYYWIAMGRVLSVSPTPSTTPFVTMTPTRSLSPTPTPSISISATPSVSVTATPSATPSSP